MQSHYFTTTLLTCCFPQGQAGLRGGLSLCRAQSGRWRSSCSEGNIKALTCYWKCTSAVTVGDKLHVDLMHQADFCLCTHLMLICLLSSSALYTLIGTETTSILVQAQRLMCKGCRTHEGMPSKVKGHTRLSTGHCALRGKEARKKTDTFIFKQLHTQTHTHMHIHIQTPTWMHTH